MPDLTDLRDAFMHLEQEFPEHYRSPVVQERLATLTGVAPRPLVHRGPPRRTVAAVLLAAAVVAALAVGLTTLLGGGGGHGSVGVQPTSSSPVPRPSPSSVPSPSTGRSVERSGGPPPAVGSALPADAGALVSFVQDGKPVTPAEYGKGAAASGQPMQPTPGSVEFTTPSGNITCAITEATVATPTNLMCLVQQFSYPAPPRPSSCQQNYAAGAVRIDQGQVIQGDCLGGPPFPPVGQILPYGSTIRMATISCRVASAFLACAVPSTGHGFVVSRTEFRAY